MKLDFKKEFENTWRLDSSPKNIVVRNNKYDLVVLLVFTFVGLFAIFIAMVAR